MKIKRENCVSVMQIIFFSKKRKYKIKFLIKMKYKEETKDKLKKQHKRI